MDPRDRLPPAGLTADQACLVENGEPMVTQCAGEIGRRYHVEPRTLLGAGYLALREAALTYDPQQHPKFPIYARHHVRGRMIDSLRADSCSFTARVLRVMDRAYEVLSTDHDIGVDLYDDPEDQIRDGTRRGADEVLAAAAFAGMSEADKADPQETEAKHLGLDEAMASLYPHEREAVDLVAMQAKTFEEAGKILRVTSRTVQRRYAAALHKLRVFLIDRESKSRSPPRTRTTPKARPRPPA